MPKGKYTRKKPLKELGKDVPKNLKFGIIVAIVIFWAEALRTFLKDFVILEKFSTLTTDTIVALVITLVGYFILAGWERIIKFLKNIKVPAKAEKV